MVYLKITDRYDMTSSVYRGHTAIMKQTEEIMKQILFLVCSKLNAPVNIFFSHVGTELTLPGYYQYFWGVNMSCSRTQHGDPSSAGTPDLWIRSPRC